MQFLKETVSVGESKVLMPTKHEGTSNVRHTRPLLEGRITCFLSRRLEVDVDNDLVSLLLFVEEDPTHLVL